jgi:hypothetical protein
MTDKRAYLKALLERLELKASVYSPGDGVSRYRFFPSDYDGNYFGPSSGLGTALGLSEAVVWLEGYRAAKYGQ